MTATATPAPISTHSAPAAAGRPGFGAVLRAEWIKLTTVRSTWWTLIALVVLGAGLTTLICWGNAEWLASDEADESPGSFITWGMMLAQAATIVLGALVVTNEYGTGMIRTTFAAVPSRGRVVAAKLILLAVVMFVVGTVTALLGYLGGNAFLDAEGIGLDLEGDVLRAMWGSGLYLAGLAVLAASAGLLLRHTAGAVSGVLVLVFVIGTMSNLIPGETGEWITKLMPANAGSALATPVMFDPDALAPWTGFGVFLAETAAVLAVAVLAVRRRDA